MCGKCLIFTEDEVLDIVSQLEAGVSLVLNAPLDAGRPDVRPQSTAPLIVPAFDTAAGIPALAHGSLGVRGLLWGFEESWKPGVVFNTRIESAGKPTWADSMLHRRCVVPVSAFFETHRSETLPSPRTGRPVKRQYEFRVPGQDVILIGCIWREGRFSMVTTEANRDMAPVHDRMPLVVRQDELLTWLGPGYRKLADRSAVSLEAEPVIPAGTTPSLF